MRVARSTGLTSLILAIVALTVFAAPALAQLQGGTVYPINGTQNPPTSFGTIANAVSYMTTNGVAGTGQVVLELHSGYAGETGYVDIPVITGTSATLGVTFRPGPGYTALTTFAGTSSNPYSINITGNYITLDGQAGGAGSTRDWTIRCTGTGTSGYGRSAVRLGKSSPTAAQTDVTIKYCILEGEAASTTSAIIGCEGGSTYTVRNILIANNLIRSTGVSGTTCRGYGITMANMSNSGNTGWVVRNNVIDKFYARGINFTGGMPGALIYGNEISHSAAVTQPSATEFSGIYFSTTASAGAKIYNNFIHDIQFATTGPSVINGVYLYNLNTSGARLQVHNNRIALGSSWVAEVYGLRDYSVANGLADFDYNSVYIGGSATSGSYNSAAFRKQVASYLNIRDNIFFNARSNAGGTGTHWGISINGTTGLVTLNYNDYYANGTGGVLGTTDGTTTGNKTTLAAWKAAVTMDTNSISQNPYYINPTGTPPDLHLNASTPTRLESGGTAIAGLDNDCDGDIRYGSPGYSGAGTAPDIGADEGDFTLLLTNDVAAGAFINPTNGSEKLVGTAFSPQASFENLGSADQNNVKVRFRIVDPGSVEVFNDSTTVNLLAGAGPQTVTFASFTPVTQGVHTMYAATELGGDQNPANDQIVGTFSAVSPLAGNYNVGAAQAPPFNTLSGAIARLNGVGISASVTFTLVDASYGPSETFPLTINAYPGMSGSYSVTIKPANPGTLISGASGTSIFCLNGCDFVVIDGASSGSSRDLTIQNTNNAASTAVVWLKSLGAGQGCTNDVVRNCIVLAGVDQSTSSNTTYGIIGTGTTIGISGGADNDYNTIANNEVRKARWAIDLIGLSSNTNDGNVISDNLVGPSAFGSEEIGAGGIIATYQNEVTITRNEVRFVGGTYALTTGGADRIGIGLGDVYWTPSGTTVTNAIVSRNLVHDVVDERTYSAVGILLAGSGSPSNNKVFNNMIYGVRANGVGDQCVGIGIGLGSGDLVAYNSISLSGDLDPGSVTTATGSGVGIRIASSTPSDLTLKDNIIAVDYTSNTTSLKHFTIVAPATSYAWGTGGENHNDYYPNPANTQMVLGGIGTGLSAYTEYATLTAWRGVFTPAQDGASVSANPPFVSATDLHLAAGTPTPLESGGVAFTGVIDGDYDNQTRFGSPGYSGAGTAPDIGADEGDFTPLFAHDVAAVAFIDPVNGGTKIQGSTLSPQASFQNLGTSSETDVPVRFRIVDSGLDEIYNSLESIASMPSGGAPVTHTFTSLELTSVGSFTMYARSELVGDEVPANDQIVGTFSVLGPLAGNYDVGAAEPAPYNTLTGAIGALNQVGVSANVTFTLVDASYGPSETFPLTINAYPGAGTLGTVTIKPANPGTTISGASATAIFVLNGADYVTLDGSSGGRGRDLTITNTLNQGSTAAVWLKSAGAGAGCVHNLVENCVLRCGVDQSQTTSNVTFGILASDGAISTTSYGHDNDYNAFVNNEVRKTTYGIYLAGVSGNANDGNLVQGNLVGPPAFGAEEIGKGGIVGTHQNELTVTENEVRFVGGLYAQTVSGTDRVGIGLGDGNWAPSGSATTNSQVTRNLVHDIVDEKTYSAVGIVVASTASPSGNRVANNMIHGVRANGTAGDQCIGIGIYNGNGDTVACNSLSLSGDLDPGSCTSATYSGVGIRIASTSASNLTLKDNIIAVDYTSNTGTLKHFTIVAPATSYAWGSGGCDFNDYYPNPLNAQMVLGGIGTSIPYGEVPTLAGWRTQFTPSQDAASISADPLYVGVPNLHISTSGGLSPVANAGTPITGVANDYDGDARTATPDIGADEFTTFLLATSVVGSGSITKDPDFPSYNPNTPVQLTAVPAPGWAFVEWSGSLTGSDNPGTLLMDADRSVTATFDYAPAISVGDAEVAEGGRVGAAFVVSLSEASPLTVEVDFATADSTALAGSDYVAVAEHLTFAPGVVADTVLVTVNGDWEVEPDEYFKALLSNAVNARMGDALGIGTIHNDDATPEISVGDVIVAEGNAGATPAAFIVSLSFASPLTVEVDFATADSTALGGSDYGAVSQHLVFAPGVVADTVVVDVTGDLDHEPDEYFKALLSNAVNADLAGALGIGTIQNDDDQPTLAIADVVLPEGSRTDALFVVTLSGTSSYTVTVDFATADSTALAGSDYTAAAGSLVFNPGTIADTVVVDVTPDLLNEADEYFQVLLSNAVNAGVADGLAVGTIQNDDALPGLSVNDVEVAEGTGGETYATFTVTLSAASGRTVRVKYATADGTALAGEDYVALPLTELIFAPGGPLAQQVQVSIVTDDLDEPDEAFYLNLSEEENATLTDPQGAGTILDDDEPSAVVERIPEITFLGGTFPNPVASRATIHYGLHQNATVGLRIFDLQGRVVRTLVSGPQAAGFKSLTWDGRDAAGGRVGAGLYLMRMEADQLTFTQRLIVLR